MNFKKNGEKISMLTCYDAMMASILDKAGVDILLVGDSLANVFQGKDSTKSVTIEEMAYHISAVSNGSQNAHILGDMPYLTYENREDALINAKKLIEAGADSVKLEGYKKGIIKHLTDNGIKVCGHIGLLPQTAEVFKVQGKEESDREYIRNQAKNIEDEGAFMVVIECVSSTLGTEITEMLSIPTIGIGAGNVCDGQVLVINDMLGMNKKTAKFVRAYSNFYDIISEAAKTYVSNVKDKTFPNKDEMYK